jgi:Na+-driven multidrug efflux pump
LNYLSSGGWLGLLAESIAAACLFYYRWRRGAWEKAGDHQRTL